MKTLLPIVLVALALLAASAQAASDADVTIIKAHKVAIEEGVITIVAEANTSITLIQAGRVGNEKGASWRGRPAIRVQVKSDTATFVIKRPREAALAEAWEMSVRAAKDLQAGKEVGRIGYYEPDISIKGNLIDSITGFGFLYDKGK